MASGREGATVLMQRAGAQTQTTEGSGRVQNIHERDKHLCQWLSLYLFIFLEHYSLLAFSLQGMGTLFLKDVYRRPTLDIWARKLRDLFSKLLILQNNQPPPNKPCQSPCWTMMVLFAWKRKLAWAAAFINFPLSLFAHLAVCRSMAKARFGPSMLSCVRDIT